MLFPDHRLPSFNKHNRIHGHNQHYKAHHIMEHDAYTTTCLHAYMPTCTSPLNTNRYPYILLANNLTDHTTPTTTASLYI